MSLWLCGMKCDWLKGGNHSLDRQSSEAECHFTWLIFFPPYICMPLKLIDFWIILYLYNPGTQVTYFKFNVTRTLTCVSSPSHRCETYWTTDGRIWHRCSLCTPQALLHNKICSARIPSKVKVPRLLLDVITTYRIGGKWSMVKWDSGTTQNVHCLLHWNITLYLIFHFKVNGAVNDSWVPAVDGGSSAPSTLQSPGGPLWSTAVNGSYFLSCDSAVQSLRSGAAVRAGTGGQSFALMTLWRQMWSTWFLVSQLRPRNGNR